MCTLSGMNFMNWDRLRVEGLAVQENKLREESLVQQVYNKISLDLFEAYLSPNKTYLLVISWFSTRKPL